MTPSVLWTRMSGRYFGVTVETMPTPMKSMAMMQAAISQCRAAGSGQNDEERWSWLGGLGSRIVPGFGRAQIVGFAVDR